MKSGTGWKQQSRPRCPRSFLSNASCCPPAACLQCASDGDTLMLACGFIHDSMISGMVEVFPVVVISWFMQVASATADHAANEAELTLARKRVPSA